MGVYLKSEKLEEIRVRLLDFLKNNESEIHK